MDQFTLGSHKLPINKNKTEMPFYIFKNPKTEEVKEILQGMNDEHVYFEDDIKWDRIFSIPAAVVDGKINPFSSKEFSEKTKNKNMTVGDMWEKSAELSNERKTKEGFDKVKEDSYNRYEATRMPGKEHPLKTKERKTALKEKLGKKGVILED